LTWFSWQADGSAQGPPIAPERIPPVLE